MRAGVTIAALTLSASAFVAAAWILRESGEPPAVLDEGPVSDVVVAPDRAANHEAATQPGTAHLRESVTEPSDLLECFPSVQRQAVLEILAGYEPRDPVEAQVKRRVLGDFVPAAVLVDCEVLAASSSSVDVRYRTASAELGVGPGDVERLFVFDHPLVSEVKLRHRLDGPPELQKGAVQALLVVVDYKRSCPLAAPPRPSRR